MTTDKERADKEAADKRERERERDHNQRERDRQHDSRIENRDQDPNHPANKTLSPAREAIPRPAAEGVHVPPEEMLTEQEKAAAAGGEGAGVGPVSAAEHTTGPVETIEDQGIGPRTPYPEGNPPPTDETITRSQGINRGDQPAKPRTPDKPLVKEPHR